MYTRVLLKLSGEQFAGERGHGIDVEFVHRLAQELKEVVQETGVQLAIVIGGGNFMRGAAIAAHGIEPATGHYMGMLATVLNGMALVDVLESCGQPARLLTRLSMPSVAEPYILRRAIRHMEKNRVVIIGGGTGNPYVTTDTAAVSAALELDAQIVLKATKVDGIYDKDPHKFPDAVRKESMSYTDVLVDKAVSVMDNAAISLAMDNTLPIVVFDLLTEGNIKRLVSGEAVGTLVS